MERLEAEKRLLQEKLDQPVSAPMSPRNNSNSSITSLSLTSAAGPIGSGGFNFISLPGSSEQAANLTDHIINLRREVSRLKANLEKAEREHKENMAKLVREEQSIREENIRLQRRLQMEVDRREALCRHLSESESSLEMDDERHFNESSRVRTISSPVSGYATNNTSSSMVNTTSSNFVQLNSNSSTSNLHSSSQIASASGDRSNSFKHGPILNVSSSPMTTNVNTINNTSKQTMMTSTASSSIQGSQSNLNPLTASSSLSSSSSSINSTNKMQPTPSLFDVNKK
jgi:hypothetical protein